MEKSMYAHWRNDDIRNLSEFTLALFQAFLWADYFTRERLMKAFPEYFKTDDLD
jgi:hypothetical protein